MKAFRYKGIIPASKSLMNRALIAQSYEPSLKIAGSSRCEDVVHLQKSLRSLKKNKTFDCGEGGTTFRFLAFRVSREKGTFLLTGSARLLSRPQTEIQSILSQLGVEVRFEKKGLRIISDGWKEPRRPVRVHARDSSQFLSALFLNSWNLDFDLKIQIQGKITSESYFVMTKKLLKELGMRFRKQASLFVIPKNQRIQNRKYRIESDLSSLFSVAAFAALSGSGEFFDFPAASLQPDRRFVKLFKKMNIKTELKKSRLKIRKPTELHSLQVNLKNSPDLFPVLAVVCAFSKGHSLLYGAPQLAIKESNRIVKMAELLSRAGIRCEIRKDGLRILGGSFDPARKYFEFDPDSDHRLAMAAALLKFQGFKIKIKNPKVVNKSFPEFWKIVGVRP